MSERSQHCLICQTPRIIFQCLHSFSLHFVLLSFPSADCWCKTFTNRFNFDYYFLVNFRLSTLPNWLTLGLVALTLNFYARTLGAFTAVWQLSDLLSFCLVTVLLRTRDSTIKLFLNYRLSPSSESIQVQVLFRLACYFQSPLSFFATICLTLSCTISRVFLVIRNSLSNKVPSTSLSTLYVQLD